MKRFETHPHRVGGIREPPVRQRVAEQQIAEFVMDAGYGTREQRQDGKANADDRKKEDPDDQCFACG